MEVKEFAETILLGDTLESKFIDPNSLTDSINYSPIKRIPITLRDTTSARIEGWRRCHDVEPSGARLLKMWKTSRPMVTPDT